MNYRLEDEMDHELPLQVEPLPLSRDILCSFPAVGSILRVIIDKGIEKHILHLLKIGNWVKLQNVLCQVDAGLWFGVLTHFTRLRYVPTNDNLIVERQRLLWLPSDFIILMAVLYWMFYALTLIYWLLIYI